MDKKRIYVVVRGIVQGVGYRYFTIKQASAYGLHGWVRNTHDGRVEALIEGNVEDLHKITEDMKKGPWSARVDGIDVDWSEYRGEFTSFGVRY